MKLLNILLLLLAAQFLAPGAQASCSLTGAGDPGCAAKGNPINIITGNKFQREVDLPPLPGVMGLEIVRYYNSALSGLNAHTGILGRGWRLSYETTIAAIGDTVQVLQADGTRLIFARDLLRPSLCSSADPANGEIDVRRTPRGDEYVWRKTDGQRLSFNPQGRLVQVLAPSGEFVSMQHDARGWLVKVTDPQGRSLRLEYLDRKAATGTRFAGVQAIASPLGRFTYGYGSAMPKEADPVDRRQLLANLVDVGMPDGARRRYHYEDGRFPTLLTGISVGETELQRYATFGYDANGEAVLSTHAGGVGRITLDRSVGGRTVLTNSLGQTTTYDYGLIAGQFRIKEVRGAGCMSCGLTNVRYGYDNAGRPVEFVRLSPTGQPVEAFRAELDALGRPIHLFRIEYRNGAALKPLLVERNAYAASGLKPVLTARPSVVPGKEFVERRTYNVHGQVLSITQEGWTPVIGSAVSSRQMTRTTRYRYRLLNNRSVLAEMDGPEQNGRTSSPEDSDITRFEYDHGGGRLVRIIEPGNLITEFSQEDVALRPTRVRKADGVRLWQTDVKYTREGQVSSHADTAWRTKNGRPVESTRRSRSENKLYDTLGRLTAHRSASDVMTRYAYANGDHLSHVIASDNSQITTASDTEGRVIEQVIYGPGGTAKQLHHLFRPGGDADYPDRQLAALDASAERWMGTPSSAVAKHSKGRVGSVAEQFIERVVLSDGSEVRRWFDDFERVVAIKSPERGVRTAQYKLDDNLSRLDDTSGIVTHVESDVSGRIRKLRSFTENRIRSTVIEYRYEGLALAETLRWENGELDNKTVWNVDVWGDVTGKSVQVFDAAKSSPRLTMNVSNLIDPDGRVIQKTLPAGTKVRYTYDRTGKLAAVSVGKTIILKVQENLTFQDGGYKATRLTFGNGLIANTVHDHSGRLISHDTGVDKVRFEFDPAGNMIGARLQQPGAAGKSRFSSDEISTSAFLASALAPQQPVSVSSTQIRTAEMAGMGDIEYGYDGNGRLTSEVREGRKTFETSYSATGDRISGRPDVRDAAGNIESRDGQRFHYGAGGELVKVTDRLDRFVAGYRYDADGIRIAKHTGNNDEFYLYEDKRLIAVFGEDGKALAEYIYIGNRPIARLLHRGADASRTTAQSNDEPFPKIEYLHADQRNAITAITDGAKAVLWRNTLSAFGELDPKQSNGAYLALRLSGQYHDSETGLYYNVHRYYDPETGRYTQPDPLGILAGYNTYAYTDSKPLDNTDPLGLHNEFKPWEFGTAVHIVFSARVASLGVGWGGNTQRGDTWPGIRPDAFYVDPENLVLESQKKNFAGVLWELKPMSWSQIRSPSNYNKALNEIKEYRTKALKGCWIGGSGRLLAGIMETNEVFYGGKVYDVTYVGDTAEMTGLIFYESKEKEGVKVPVLAPAPSLTTEQKKKLDEQMQGIKVAVKQQEGWSDLAIKGLQALILAAITVAVAVFAAAVVALILSMIAAYLATMTSGLVLGLLAMFGISSVATASDLEKKGAEAESGIFENVTNWFKDLLK